MTATKLLINFLLVALSFQCAQCSDSCGRSLEKYLQTRIISGYDIGYYKYPWFGIIKKSGNIKCGCAMVNEQFCITVASCFKNYLPVTPDHNITGVYTVTLGVYDRCNANETTQKTFAVQTIFIHSGFEVSKRANNIALVKLSEATSYEPVCLPAKPILEADRPSEGIITGAGMTNYMPLVKTCVVYEARVLIYKNDYCNQSLMNIGEDPSLINNNFCAGGAKETKPYGCGADLGGPLIVENNNNNTNYLLGLISFKKCPDNDNITLYVDVSQYLVWIQTTIDSSKPATPPPPPPSPTTSTTEAYDEYDEYYSTSTTSTSSTTSTTTPSSYVLGQSKRHGHNTHGQKKHGGHLKREAKTDHQAKHHGKHEGKHHKKHHHEEEHDIH